MPRTSPRRHRREVDVVEDAVRRPFARPAPSSRRRSSRGAVGARRRRTGRRRGGGPEVLRERHRAHAVQRAFHGAADGAGVERVLGDVVAAVDAGDHQVGRRSLEDLVEPGQHAVGGRALDGEAPRPRAVPAASAARRRRECATPDCSKAGATTQTSPSGPASSCGDLLGHPQARRADAVVVGDQDAHRRSLGASRPSRHKPPPRPATRRARRDLPRRTTPARVPRGPRDACAARLSARVRASREASEILIDFLRGVNHSSTKVNVRRPRSWPCATSLGGGLLRTGPRRR